MTHAYGIAYGRSVTTSKATRERLARVRTTVQLRDELEAQKRQERRARILTRITSLWRGGN